MWGNKWNRKLKRKLAYLCIVGFTSMTVMACGDTTSGNQKVTVTPCITEDENEAYALVRDGEEVIVKFQLIATGETVVICTYKETEEYLVVRIGADSQINFEYPINLEDSWKQFELHTYLRGGGPGNEGMDLRYLTFQDDNFLYTIYEEYYSEDNSTSIGLRKVNLETGVQQELEGDYSSLEGSISSLEDNGKIEVVED